MLLLMMVMMMMQRFGHEIMVGPPLRIRLPLLEMLFHLVLGSDDDDGHGAPGKNLARDTADDDRIGEAGAHHHLLHEGGILAAGANGDRVWAVHVDKPDDGGGDASSQRPPAGIGRDKFDDNGDLQIS